MTRLFRYPVPRSKDTLTELRYEIYLERYHNISHEITAMRTKTAIIMGIIGVVFTIILSLYANSPNYLAFDPDIIWIFGALFLVLFFNYFLLYFYVHIVDLADYLNKTTLRNLDSGDTKRPDYYSMKTLRSQILSDLNKTFDEYFMKYKFYKGISGVMDIMFILLFGIGGIALINIFLGSPITNWIYVLFMISSLLLLAGCGTITIILLLGKWCMDNIFNLRAIGLYIFFLVLNVLLLRIYG